MASRIKGGKGKEEAYNDGESQVSTKDSRAEKLKQ